MGIQLDDFDKDMLRAVARYRDENASIYPYLFGVLASSIDLFVSGLNEKRDLESMWSSVKLIENLGSTLSVQELLAVADGTREVAGEDVPSGQ